MEHRGNNRGWPLTHHTVHLRGGIVVDHTRHAHVLLILLHTLLGLTIEVAGLQFGVALEHHVQTTHHLSEEVGLLIDTLRCSRQIAITKIATTGLNGLDDGFRLMLGILCCRLGEGYHSIETGIELNLDLAQSILAQFIEINQRTLGGDEVTSDNHHEGDNNK